MAVARTRTFRSGDKLVIVPRSLRGRNDSYPARITIREMIDGLRALAAPPFLEQRDAEEIPAREGL
jgi:hypothetical protein